MAEIKVSTSPRTTSRSAPSRPPGRQVLARAGWPADLVADETAVLTGEQMAAPDPLTMFLIGQPTAVATLLVDHADDEVCLWWPFGCRTRDSEPCPRLCWDCCDDDERCDLIDSGCREAATRQRLG